MSQCSAGFGQSPTLGSKPPYAVSAPLSSIPPALTKGSGSFMELEAVGSSSPDMSMLPPSKMFTPQPPDVAAQRRQTFGRPSTGVASDALSDASTAIADFGIRPVPLRDLDSPAIASKPSPRVPSVPQKLSGSHSRKSTSPSVSVSPSDEQGGAIQPRALSGALNQTDPVNDLVENAGFAQRLALSTPPGSAAADTPPADGPRSGASSGTSAMLERMEAQFGVDAALDQRHRSSSLAFALTEAEQRKRQKPLMQPLFGRQSSASSAEEEAMPPPAPQLPGFGAAKHHQASSSRGPPPLHRGNSMADTKVLFSTAIARLDKKHGSFAAAPVGTRDFVFEDKYSWGPLLGRGSFADVYVVFHRSTSSRKAVKVSNKAFRSRGERAKYVHEVELAEELGTHTNIVEYYVAWQEERKFYMLMELCDGGTLRDHLRREGAALRLPQRESSVWNIVLHISRGLVHMHAMAIIHCDLKPDNILISADGAFKIGDLGLATTIEDWRDGMEGDAVYLSRDLLEGSPSVFADIFSLGLMLLEIVSGEQLPGCETPEDAARWNELRDPLSADQPAAPRVSPPASCSVHMQRLITRAMSPVPFVAEPGDARPTAQQFLNATMSAVAATASASGVPRRRI